MIKLKQIINEVPVDVFQTIGDFEKGSSYKDRRDRDIIRNPVTLTKVKDFFKNTTVDFDFYFVKDTFCTNKEVTSCGVDTKNYCRSTINLHRQIARFDKPIEHRQIASENRIFRMLQVSVLHTTGTLSRAQ